MPCKFVTFVSLEMFSLRNFFHSIYARLINAQFELNYKSVDQFTSTFVFIEHVPTFAIGIFDHFVGLG